MATAHLIAVKQLCAQHNITFAFITALSEAGLIEITVANDELFLPESNLHKLEKIIHLHHELDINIEGIEAVTHLLQKIGDMQQEILLLKNRLKRYEE